MTLSTQTLNNLASALKPDVMEYVLSDHRLADVMIDILCDAIKEKLGPVDNEVLIELSCIIFEHIEIK
jgi:hypothetical protein